jgi:hypothetical protein
MFKNLSIGGGVGLLIGLALVWQIEPTEAGGIGLLVLIPIAICTALGGALSLGKNKRSDESGSKRTDDETSKDQTDHDGD